MKKKYFNSQLISFLNNNNNNNKRQTRNTDGRRAKRRMGDSLGQQHDKAYEVWRAQEDSPAVGEHQQLQERPTRPVPAPEAEQQLQQQQQPLQ